MKWDDIRILHACLSHDTLSAAAHALDIQQSTISRRIQALEDQLGAALFVRHAGGVTPTELAIKLSSHATAMEEHMMALERIARGHLPEPRGKVRVALIEPVALYMVMPRMSAFRAAHSEILLDLFTDYTFADLSRLEADIALRFARPQAGDLVAKKLRSIPLKVIASRAYIAQYGTPTLHSGRWVCVDLPHMKTPEADWFYQHVTLEPWLTSNSYVIATEAILSGQCVGVTTEVVEHMAHHDLVTIDLEVPMPEPLELWMVAHRSMRHVPRIETVWSWLERVMTSST